MRISILARWPFVRLALPAPAQVKTGSSSRGQRQARGSGAHKIHGAAENLRARSTATIVFLPPSYATEEPVSVVYALHGYR
jgi:hypothetical protein